MPPPTPNSEEPVLLNNRDDSEQPSHNKRSEKTSPLRTRSSPKYRAHIQNSRPVGVRVAGVDQHVGDTRRNGRCRHNSARRDGPRPAHVRGGRPGGARLGLLAIFGCVFLGKPRFIDEDRPVLYTQACPFPASVLASPITRQLASSNGTHVYQHASGDRASDPVCASR